MSSNNFPNTQSCVTIHLNKVKQISKNFAPLDMPAKLMITTVCVSGNLIVKNQLQSLCCCRLLYVWTSSYKGMCRWQTIKHSLNPFEPSRSKDRGKPALYVKTNHQAELASSVFELVLVPFFHKHFWRDAQVLLRTEYEEIKRGRRGVLQWLVVCPSFWKS